jgi:hypothetical protein
MNLVRRLKRRVGKLVLHDIQQPFRERSDRRRFLKVEAPRLRKLKDRHAGKRCFIIGNGPSIKEQNLLPLKDEYTFAVNWFVLHPHFQELDIKYFCVSDPWLLWARGEAAADLMCPLSESKSTLFFERRGRPVIERSGLFLDRELYYLWMHWNTKVESGVMSLDIADRVLHGRSVIINFCIPVAYYMGFSKIYLLGCDANWTISKPPTQRQDYFYDERRVHRYGVFHTPEEEAAIFNVLGNWAGVKKVFEQTDCKIFNAGTGGNLNFFPRVPLENVLKETSEDAPVSKLYQ